MFPSLSWASGEDLAVVGPAADGHELPHQRADEVDAWRERGDAIRPQGLFVLHCVALVCEPLVPCRDLGARLNQALQLVYRECGLGDHFTQDATKSRDGEVDCAVVCVSKDLEEARVFRTSDATAL